MPEAIKEKDMQSISEDVKALRETFDKVDEKIDSKNKSYDEKFIMLEGLDKEKVLKLTKALDEQEVNNQKLTLEIQKGENEKKLLNERMENLEKNIISNTQKDINLADYKKTNEYKAFNKFMVAYGQNKTFNPDLLAKETKDYLRTDNGEQGGYLVPEILDNQVQRNIIEITPVLPLVRLRTLPGVKTLHINVKNGRPTAYWVGEHEKTDKSKPTYKLVALNAHALGIKVETTRDLLNFAHIDIVGEITTDAIEEFSREIGKVILLGNGVNKPQGILDASSGVARINTASAGTVTMDDAILLSGNLKIGYNPVYFFNLQTLVSLRVEKDGTGNYLWRIGGENQPTTINGYKYVVMQDMPSIATGNDPIGFGDLFRAYTFMDAMGLEVIRDDVTLADQRAVLFNMFKFVDGKVTLPEAIKLLRVKS